jgi:hypothetical protein
MVQCIKFSSAALSVYLSADMFDYCYSLKSIIFPPTVSGFYSANLFSQCVSLTSIICPKNETQIWNYAFSACYSLNSVTFPEALTTIGNYAFANCYNLKNLVIPNNVTSIGIGAFSACYSLSSITLPGSLTTIGANAFANCPALSSVILGDNFDITVSFSTSIRLTVSAMVSMFGKLKDNTGLTAKTLTLGTVNLAKLTADQKAIATNKNWTLA